MLIVRRSLALLSIVFFFSCAAYVQNAKPSSYETAIDNSGEKIPGMHLAEEASAQTTRGARMMTRQPQRVW